MATDTPTNETKSTRPQTRPAGAPRSGGGRPVRASGGSKDNRSRSNNRDAGSRGGGAGGQRRNERGGQRRSRKPRERVRPEFDQKIVSIRRVTRVVAGGRRFSFSVAIIAGNGKGKVGVGLGKASDTALAIEKALRDAKRNMIDIKTNENQSIPHEIGAKYAASHIILMPVPGVGLRAGSSVRTVLELAGVKDVSAKILSRSKNRYNNAQATIESLKKLKV